MNWVDNYVLGVVWRLHRQRTSLSTRAEGCTSKSEYTVRLPRACRAHAVVVCWATSTRAGTTNSYPNLNPPPPNPTAQNERRRYRIKLLAHLVQIHRPPTQTCRAHAVGGVLSNKNTHGSDQLVVSNLNFPPPPNPTAAIIRIVLLMVNHASPRQRNLFADKSTFEAKHRSYCTKSLFDSKSMDPSDAVPLMIPWFT
jgi:hypothetical protein